MTKILKAAVAVTLAAALSAHAQTGTSAPVAPASPAKKELAARLVVLQQSNMEQLSRNLAEQPARQLLSAAEPILRNQVPADKREAVAKQLQEDARKYVDEVTPIVRKRALELAKTMMQPAFEEKYSEEELKQLVNFFESPVFKKLQQTQPQMDQALGRALVDSVKDTIEPKARALQATMAKTLGVEPPAGAGAPAPTSAQPSAPAAKTKPPSPAASKP
jgi:hypothetical protein